MAEYYYIDVATSMYEMLRPLARPSAFWKMQISSKTCPRALRPGGVDGRDKPGHDNVRRYQARRPPPQADKAGATASLGDHDGDRDAEDGNDGQRVERIIHVRVDRSEERRVGKEC